MKLLVFVVRMSGFAVVRWFHGDGKSTSTVPEKWIVTISSQLTCFYPNINVMKAVKEQHDVRGNWKSYPVERVTKKSIKKYDDARIKEDEYCVTSGIDESQESNDENENCSNVPKTDGTRIRQKPVHFDDYTDASEDVLLGKLELIEKNCTAACCEDM